MSIGVEALIATINKTPCTMVTAAVSTMPRIENPFISTVQHVKQNFMS